MMIRNELKNDPTGFVSKNLDGICLNVIEELYLVNKCPNLFDFILYPSTIAQRLYVMRVPSHDLSINNINNSWVLKKALKKRPDLCIKLDIKEFEKDVYNCIDTLHKNRDIYTLERLLSNKYIPNSILRKILLLEPRLVVTAIQSGNTHFDQDIEMYIFRTNPLLIEKFEYLSTVSVNKIFRMGIENSLYIRKWVHVIDKDTLVYRICKYIMDTDIDCMHGHVIEIIKHRPAIFSEVIKTLYKNGFNMDTKFAVRLLLKEFNDLIDDEVASYIIKSDI